MELWQLRTFSVVAKTLHFRRAAEELNLSQPAVSHQIKSLEKKIGKKLFIRDKDGVLLTKAGQTMYEHATKILDLADELRLEIKENTDALKGTIVIGAVTRGLSDAFSMFYKEFRSIYPEIEVIVQFEYKLEDIVSKVRKGIIDVGLVSHNLDLGNLVVVPYGEYELVLVVGRNHPLAKLGEISAKDLQNQKWIMFEPSVRLRGSVDDYLSKIGVTARDVYESNDGAFIRAMIEYNDRISLLPEWGVFEELRDGRLVHVKIKAPRCKIHVNLIWKASRWTKAMSAILSHVIEEKLQGIHPFESAEEK